MHTTKIHLMNILKDQGCQMLLWWTENFINILNIVTDVVPLYLISQESPFEPNISFVAQVTRE